MAIQQIQNFFRRGNVFFNFLSQLSHIYSGFNPLDPLKKCHNGPTGLGGSPKSDLHNPVGVTSSGQGFCVGTSHVWRSNLKKEFIICGGEIEYCLLQTLPAKRCVFGYQETQFLVAGWRCSWPHLPQHLLLPAMRTTNKLSLSFKFSLQTLSLSFQSSSTKSGELNSDTIFAFGSDPHCTLCPGPSFTPSEKLNSSGRCQRSPFDQIQSNAD